MNIAESMNVTKMTFAKGSFQNNILATFIIIRKTTQSEIQIGCCINSVKNLNGFLIFI